jgi:hypothetical protein
MFRRKPVKQNRKFHPSFSKKRQITDLKKRRISFNSNFFFLGWVLHFLAFF